MSKNHAFITAQPVGKDLIFESKSRRLGGLPVNPSGQWDAFLPPDDVQNIGVEPEACASFGTLHAVETLARHQFNDATPYSDRFLAQVSGTTHQGNDPHLVAETLRNYGCVDAELWPYTADVNTWEKFYEEPPLEVKAMALNFGIKFDFGHEYVPGDIESMKRALQYSPLGAAVWAWSFPDQNGYYFRDGNMQDDHWVTIYGYEEGKYWKCFDSYTSTHKQLAWDFGFTCVKRYTLNKQVIDRTLIGMLIKLLQSILALPNRVGFKLGLVGATLPTNTQLAWGDPIAARHSCRVVMDSFNLSWAEKGLLCSVIAEESGFKNTAVNYNRRADGTVSSTDYGICQINDKYHVGPSLDFPSVEYVVAHPEEAVAFMVRMYRAGQIKLWCAYQNGGYLKHMPDGVIK